MKRMAFILLASFLFAFLDWQSVHLTRWVHPEWKEWMHEDEKRYALLTRPLEFILCTPCMALKPVFYTAITRVWASQEEQDSITHAPQMDWSGFYQLPERGYSWTFVPWFWWAVYWTPPTLLWWMASRKVFR